MNDFWKDKTMHDFPYSRDDFAKAYFFAIHKWLELLEESLAEQNVVNIQECVEKIDELTERGFRYFDDPIDPNKDYREGTD